MCVFTETILGPWSPVAGNNPAAPEPWPGPAQMGCDLSGVVVGLVMGLRTRGEDVWPLGVWPCPALVLMSP